MDELRWVAACERNREPILARLREAFAEARRVIEIGAGSGQHAEYFAAAMPDLEWQPSEQREQVPALAARVAAAGLPNLDMPFDCDVRAPGAGLERCDALFSANTLHIMPAVAVEALFARVVTRLAAPRRVAIYGPFRYAGRHTSASNQRFDAELRARGAGMGVRDIETVDGHARAAGLVLVADHAMPANNRLLVWCDPGLARVG